MRTVEYIFYLSQNNEDFADFIKKAYISYDVSAKIVNFGGFLMNP